MKKCLVALMLLVLALALVACGGGEAETTEPATEPVTEHVHVFVEQTTPATCTTAGKVVSKCECGEIENETEIPVIDHTASEMDCEKDTVCTVCNVVLAEKTGHIVTATEVVTAATCSTAGKEKGACTVCGKIIEADVPALGHILAKDGDIKAADGGYAINCESCKQDVVIKAADPVFKLTFDDIVAEAAENELGLEIVAPEKWSISEYNGSKALLSSGKSYYINVPDAAKLAEMGTFVVSFDYMSTQEAAQGDKASAFSFLGNAYNGATSTGKGSVVWGWVFKLNEEKNVFTTAIDTAKIDSTNSMPIERNVNYKVDIVVVPTARISHLFVNGAYVGTTNNVIPTIDIMGENNLCLRFGDGPNCGHVFDNFVIADLK